jgi:multiple antibiotic resistance protein
MFDWSELTNWQEYTQLLISLLAMVPPSVLIPFFLSLVGKRTPEEQKQIALISSIGFSVVSIVFVFLGDAILNVFSITIDTFRIAGGILLGTIAFYLLNSGAEDTMTQADTASSAVSISLVPMTIPMLSGPGAISTVVIFSSLHEGLSHKILVSLVIITVSIFIYFMFSTSLKLGRFFTPGAALAFNRIMGLIMMAIAIEFILHGLGGHFPDLNIVH